MDDTPALDPLARQFVLSLRRARLAKCYVQKRGSPPYGLTEEHVAILALLGHREGLTITQIARVTASTPDAVSSALSVCAHSGLCARIQPDHPAYQLTSHGDDAIYKWLLWSDSDIELADVPRDPSDKRRLHADLREQELKVWNIVDSLLEKAEREDERRRSCHEGAAMSFSSGKDLATMEADGTKDVARLGEDLYQQRLRTQLEKTNQGHYLVINVKTGEYVIEATGVAARKTFDKLFPGAPSYSLRIGIPISA